MSAYEFWLAMRSTTLVARRMASVCMTPSSLRLVALRAARSAASFSSSVGSVALPALRASLLRCCSFISRCSS